jgi:chromosomal replication initiation ATPase DnaA
MMEHPQLIFSRLIENLRKRYRPDIFEQWFAPLEYMNADHKTLIIRVPSPEAKYILEHKYFKGIASALEEIGYPDLWLRYEVEGPNPRQR